MSHRTNIQRSGLVLMLMLIASCSAPLYQEKERALPATSPHMVCANCHADEMPSKEVRFLGGADPSSLCITCHQYRENHHPIDFLPDASFKSPFPLFKGEIRCLTCHEVHGGQGRSGTPMLLRGGPYTDRREQCFLCHFKEKYAEVDPHLMLDAEGKVTEYNGKPICLMCHSVKPDPILDRTKDVRFRADVGFLCWRCHPPMPGIFFDQHFLVRPSERSLSLIKRAERELGIIFPLVPRNRITCSTCHNPHQKEVIFSFPAARGADSLHRNRMPAPAICTACHPLR